MRVLLYSKQKTTSSAGLLPNTNLFMPPVATEKCLGRAALGRVPPLLFQQETILGLHEVSILGLLGCVVSLLLGLRFIRAIGKSEQLDRKE